MEELHRDKNSLTPGTRTEASCLRQTRLMILATTLLPPPTPNPPVSGGSSQAGFQSMKGYTAPLLSFVQPLGKSPALPRAPYCPQVLETPGAIATLSQKTLKTLTQLFPQALREKGLLTRQIRKTKPARS